jgi:glycosyltransferase involved in cell wall biosynthesis
VNTLHVDLGRDWRGGQNQALLLMRGLLERGHGAELVALRDSPMARRAQAAGVKVHEVAWATGRLGAALKLSRLLGRGKYEVVHVHEAHGLTAAWIAGAHGLVSVIASRRLAYPLSRSPFALARYRCARRIIAVSEFVRRSVLAAGMAPERVEVVYDGVLLPGLPSSEERSEARRALLEPGDAPVLGCVGYLLPEKGQELLVRAIPAVRSEFPRCRLLLAGEGPSRTRLENLTRELDLAPAVRFLGFVENITEVYRALDVFVFPSLAEPLGSSLLTAMAHGLPSVALAGGAVPEIIEDGRDGLLVSGAEPEELAGAVVRLLRDEALRAALGAGARSTIEARFSDAHMVAATLEVYVQACHEGDSPVYHRGLA